MTIYRGPGGAGEAHTDADVTEVRLIMIEAKGYRDETEAFAAEAGIDADDAQAAASAAALSEANAAASEAAAASSESAAATSEANAATSETKAAASEVAAASSETNAAASEDAAAASEAAAAISEANAAASETAAALSETNAATSETNAAASEAAAAASEAAAATSESNAATSEANAAASAASAAASFDNFDDRYLGAKDTDPTVDNDGNALLEGALYWNSVADEFRAWNGTGWEGLTGLPSVSGNSGKFLYTDGSVASWANVPDPQPATPTDDGLVFGSTPSTAPKGGVAGPHGIKVSNQYYQRPYNLLLVTGYTGNYLTGGDLWATTVALPIISQGYDSLVGQPVYINGVLIGTFNSYTTYSDAFEVRNDSITAAYEVGYPETSYISTPVVGANTSLGYGSNNDNGSLNVTIGYGAGSSITTGSNLTVVGYDAEPSSATATNEATLGNSDTTKTRLWGAIAVDDDTGTSGQVLTSNGTGSATWETPAAAPVTSVNGYTGAVSLTASDVGAATSSDISTAIAALVDSAPTTLDTLNELAAALGDDANFASTVTTALAAKAPLSNPTFTGTVTADYLVGDGSGITGIDSFPSQTGNSGKYLTTDGSSVSWAAVDALPDQTGNSGKYLTTDGSAASWAVLDTDANTTTKGLYEMANTISTTYAITAGNNAMSAGPITVTGSVTVPSGSVWTIV